MTTILDIVASVLDGNHRSTEPCVFRVVTLSDITGRGIPESDALRYLDELETKADTLAEILADAEEWWAARNKPVPLSSVPTWPPVPDGYDRWEYRGKGWDNNGKPATYAMWTGRPGEPWSVTASRNPCGDAWLHYLEAVPTVSFEPPYYPPPPVPEGYARWEYRGRGWDNPEVRETRSGKFPWDTPVTAPWAVLGFGKWVVHSGRGRLPAGYPNNHYMEAVR